MGSASITFMPANDITEVNHWRGRCLDDFARAEQAIIRFIERWKEIAPSSAPALDENASARTRNVTSGLQKHFPDDAEAKALVKLLSLWKHREKDRNDLVHGLFTVKSNSDGWAVVNKTISVKKQVASVREQLYTAAQAEAFRTAVTSERKSLETALTQFSSFTVS